MLTYEDYQLLHQLKESDPDAYELINKISNFSLDSVSRACHDLRNYAGLIDSYCQLLSISNPELSENSYFQKISYNMERLISLFDEIGHFRYGFRNNESQTDDLAQCILRSIQLFENEDNNIASHISFSYDSNLTYPILCKNPYITDAITALIRNSIEACDPNQMQLNITLETTPDNYTLVLQDNGSGFSEEMLSKGITPFESEKSKHFGLGLSTAAIIILKNDGNYKISNLDCGSCITITFPKPLS